MEGADTASHSVVASHPTPPKRERGERRERMSNHSVPVALDPMCTSSGAASAEGTHMAVEGTTGEVGYNVIAFNVVIIIINISWPTLSRSPHIVRDFQTTNAAATRAVDCRWAARRIQANRFSKVINTSSSSSSKIVVLLTEHNKRVYIEQRTARSYNGRRDHRV